MTPKSKNFRKCLYGFRDGTPNYVSWRNLMKIGRCKVAEKLRGLPNKKKHSGSAGLVPAPILPKMGWSRPKFPERCHPLTCPRIPNLVRIGYVLPDLFRKDWFFGPKSQYNKDFQPTNSNNIKYIKYFNKIFGDCMLHNCNVHIK